MKKYVIYTDEEGHKSHYRLTNTDHSDFLMLLHDSGDFFFVCHKESKGLKFVSEKEYKKSVAQALKKREKFLKNNGLGDACINLKFERQQTIHANDFIYKKGEIYK